MGHSLGRGQGSGTESDVRERVGDLRDRTRTDLGHFPHPWDSGDSPVKTTRAAYMQSVSKCRGSMCLPREGTGRKAVLGCRSAHHFWTPEVFLERTSDQGPRMGQGGPRGIWGKQPGLVPEVPRELERQRYRRDSA